VAPAGAVQHQLDILRPAGDKAIHVIFNGPADKAELRIENFHAMLLRSGAELAAPTRAI
jgi:effector-binding domain-containing protein